MNRDREDQVKKEVEEAFAELEERLESGFPGVADVLRVYGECELAMQSNENYRNLIGARPTSVAVAGTEALVPQP